MQSVAVVHDTTNPRYKRVSTENGPVLTKDIPYAFGPFCEFFEEMHEASIDHSARYGTCKLWKLYSEKYDTLALLLVCNDYAMT